MDAIQVHEFTREAFGQDFHGGTASPEYLWAYLEELGATSMVREADYVDRHYLDDFTNFYARSFHPPDPHCRRLHFFSAHAEVLGEHLARAYRVDNLDDLAYVERELNAAYLGFVVCRPLRGAEIGRTVLRTYPPDGARRFTVLRTYRVHLGALRLRLEGLAFQQQDVQAAVCASTALWCALQKVADVAGKRTPTPSHVTRAANSPYPASYGLTDPEMATALATLGYTADTFEPGDPHLFRAKLAACLRSHLPVILMVGGEDGGHAVCVTGYRDPRKTVLVPPYEDADSSVAMRTGSLKTIYVHDDNLGSHAHYELLDVPPPELEKRTFGSGEEALWLMRGKAVDADAPWWRPDCLAVKSALVPKPWKVRMPVDDLVQLTWSLRHRVDLVFDGLPLTYDARFTSGVDYRRELIGSTVDRARLRDFDWQTGLPRHVAVVTVATGDDDLCDLIVDATAIHIDPDEDSVLAIVARGVPMDSIAWKALNQVAEDAGAPIIGAPSTLPSR